MGKYICILILNCFLSFSINGQNPENSRKIDNRTNLKSNNGESNYTLYGKLKVFPSGKLIYGIEMILSFTDSLKYYYVNYGLDGQFSLQLDFHDITNINIRFSDSNSREKETYYPIEIRNARFDNDSMNLGIIPIIVDTFGYFEEWGTFEKKNYWNRTISDIENRLEIESKLNKIYNSICINCNPIFITEVDKKESETNISHSELRKFRIEYHELILLTKYFNSTKTETISNTKH